MYKLTQSIYTFSKIGFLGLGNMGLPMAINLVKNGHQVYAFDVDQSKKQQAQKNHISFHPQIKAIAKSANIFVTMLPNSEHSKSVCQKDDGLFKNATKGSLIIDCSTISPMVAKSLNQQGKQYGINYVDAPVSGGVTGATAGTLTFMVGSQNQSIFQLCSPILSAMGKNMFNCGRVGGGQIAKLCNNMALAVQMIGISEAAAMGKKLGMDQKILANIMKVSTSRCWSVDTYNPVPGVMENVPSSRNYQKGFACDLMLKDLGLAIEAAQNVKVDPTLGKQAKAIYTKLSNQGLGKKDFGVIYQSIMNKK